MEVAWPDRDFARNISSTGAPEHSGPGATAGPPEPLKCASTRSPTSRSLEDRLRSRTLMIQSAAVRELLFDHKAPRATTESEAFRKELASWPARRWRRSRPRDSGAALHSASFP